MASAQKLVGETNEALLGLTGGELLVEEAFPLPGVVGTVELATEPVGVPVPEDPALAPPTDDDPDGPEPPATEDDDGDGGDEPEMDVVLESDPKIVVVTDGEVGTGSKDEFGGLLGDGEAIVELEGVLIDVGGVPEGVPEGMPEGGTACCDSADALVGVVPEGIEPQ